MPFKKGVKYKVADGVYTDAREYHIPYTAGIDNADVADLFQIGNGCERRLYYKKTATPPDYNIKPYNSITDATIRTVSLLYYAQTERNNVRAMKNCRSPVYRSMVSHTHLVFPGEKPRTGIDAIIRHVPTEEYIRYKYEGPTEIDILEANHAAICRDRTWACIIVYCPFQKKLLSFDIEREAGIEGDLSRSCEDLWLRIKEQSPPDRHAISDLRCRTCQFSITCHGNDHVLTTLNHEVDDIVADLKAMEATQRAADTSIKSARAAILKAMNGRERFRTSFYTLEHTEKSQVRIDSASLLKAYPELKEKFGKKITSKELKLVAWNEGL